MMLTVNRLIASPSLLEAKEGMLDGPVTSRPASLGLLVVSLRNVNTQLGRSQSSLTEYQERLTSLQSLPISELVRLAEVDPTDKLPTVVVRRMASDKLTTTISNKTREVGLCAGIVEGLTFLVWRHLEHYLLYSSAAQAAGTTNPLHQTFNKQFQPLETGITSAHKASFTEVGQVV